MMCLLALFIVLHLVRVHVGGDDAELRPSAGMTALHLAAAGGHRAAVEALVRNGADVSKKVWQLARRRDAADLARKAGHGALVNYLMSVSPSA